LLLEATCDDDEAVVVLETTVSGAKEAIYEGLCVGLWRGVIRNKET